jgi:crossover junction endodeoxyribonuclease RuvC
MRVFGIDPGLRITGYALVTVGRGELEPTLSEAGVIRLDAKQPLEQRLGQLSSELRTLIEQLQPDHMAVENLYSHYKHPRTAILMGHARGVILLCASEHEIPVRGIAANAVKKAITGYGHASKHQVQLAIKDQCNLSKLPRPPDLADAIAIALTCARRIAVERL